MWNFKTLSIKIGGTSKTLIVVGLRTFCAVSIKIYLKKFEQEEMRNSSNINAACNTNIGMVKMLHFKVFSVMYMYWKDMCFSCVVRIVGKVCLSLIIIKEAMSLINILMRRLLKEDNCQTNVKIIQIMVHVSRWICTYLHTIANYSYQE